MNWQTELNSSLSWILTALFWVIVCFSVTTLALKQTTFGQKFWHIASPSINRRNGIKIIVMLLVLFTMILLEVRFSVLNSFFYNGLYSSMQDVYKRQLMVISSRATACSCVFWLMFFASTGLYFVFTVRIAASS